MLKKIRKINVATHRDLGYFFSGLIVIYALSGIALNHIETWNPDFIISKKTIRFDETYLPQKITVTEIARFDKMVGESSHKLYDIPTPNQIKIYYEDATLHLNFSTHTGQYEKITRRPVFYHMNLLHKNSIKGWKWASDVFAGILIIITISGLFILKGKKGFSVRGKWFMLAGILPPILAILFSSYFSK